MLRFRDAIGEIGIATAQLAHARSEGQQANALRILVGTTRRLYSILAEDV
jgi:hypothetical protein